MASAADPNPPAGEPTPERIEALIRRHAPSFWREKALAPDLRLDDEGIGFDSVALLELLLSCERELGLSLPPDFLLDDAMTVGRLVEKLRGAAAAA